MAVPVRDPAGILYNLLEANPRKVVDSEVEFVPVGEPDKGVIVFLPLA